MQANHKYKIYTVASYANMSYKDFEDNLMEYDNIDDISCLVVKEVVVALAGIRTIIITTVMTIIIVV